MNPNITSYFKIFLLKKIGSNKAENNDPVDIQITATETFDDLIAPKKKDPMKSNNKAYA